ncbi:MAG TPA: phage portal protein [Clostridia bacterium]|nr:phage portal protein [Clostridia bacterium]
MPSRIIDKMMARFGYVRPSASTDGTTTITIDQLIDLLNTGKTRGKSGALSEITYYSCMKILSEAIGKLPYKLLRRNVDGGVDEARDHYLYRILRYQPNPYMTATHFWSTVELCRNHFGNAYVMIRGAGRDMSLWILDPGRMRIWWDDAKMLADAPMLWYVYNDEKGKQHILRYDEVLHFKTSMSLDAGVTGLPVCDILSLTVQSNITAQRTLDRLYENGFVAKAIVQYTGALNKELEKGFVKLLEDYAQGKVEESPNFIPIPLGTSITPLNIKLTDAQFIEIRRYSALQIAGAFGIKPVQINDYEKASYAASEQQNLAFYVDTLLYPLKQYEEETSNKLLANTDIDVGFFPKFNVQAILRADYKTQLESLTNAVQKTVLTPNEARGELDRPAKPGGDELMVNGGYVPVGMAGKLYEKGGNGNG